MLNHGTKYNISSYSVIVQSRCFLLILGYYTPFYKYKLCKKGEISKRANKEYLKGGKFKHRKLQC